MANPLIENKKPTGKLGVLIPGLGAVATTFIEWLDGWEAPEGN